MTDSEVAIALVSAAAAIVRSRYGGNLGRVDKGAGDFATDADVEAERAMLEILRRSRPGDRIVAEESGISGPADAEREWLLNPLCGTLNYAARMQVVAVNAALRVRDRFVVAAVSDPFNDEVYWTDSAHAFVRSTGQDRRLEPSSSSRLVDLNLDPPFPSAPAFSAAVLASRPEFIRQFKPRVVSSTMAVTWVATGQRAGYITDGMASDKMVHFAAGLALCTAAGSIVTDLHGVPWKVGSMGLIIGADADTHRALLTLVTQR